MAYGEKYKYYFYWDHDDSNNYYKVSILEEGYASTVTTLIVGTNPFTQAIKGQIDTSDNPILGSEAKYSIIATGAEYLTYDTDFLESDYKDFIVKLIQDPDGTPIIKWTGILLPANASRNFYGGQKIYSLSAVDGLADLKNKKYSTSGDDTGSPYTGLENILVIIKTALSKAADITELQLDFKIQLNTYSDLMASTENAFKENEIAQELFYQVKNGETVYDSCYEVLQKILTPFFCSMSQSDGYYWIFNNNERASYVFEYDWATLTQQSRTLNDRTVDIEAYKWYGRGNLYKTAPYYSVSAKLYNKNYDPELIVNGGFDTTITGWTNGDADDDSNLWDDLDYFDYPAVGGTVSMQWAGAATAGNYNFHTTNTFNIEYGAGKQTVEVWVRVEYNSVTPGGGSFPLIRMRLYNGTNGYIAGTVGATTLGTVGGFVNIRESFVVTSGVSVNANYLDIEIQVTDAATTSVQFYIDNISATQASENDPSDWLYNGYRSSGSQSRNKEIIAYIAEQQESDNDICAIKDSGGTYVSDWSRYLLNEGKQLINILQRLLFNSNSRYMSYVKGTIYDPNETIESHKMPTATSGVPIYRIIGMEKNYREAAVKVDMIETETPLTDVSMATGRQKLTSQYGESQD